MGIWPYFNLFDGTGYQKCPSNFFILCEYIGNVYTYIYQCLKFVSNFVMGLKIWCQVGEFEFHFQNSYGEMCFSKIMLKVRSFKSTGDHRPFLSKFDVKLGSWGTIHTGEHSPLEVSTKPSHLPPGSSAGFTPRARSASLIGWMGWWMDGWDGISKGSFKFIYTLWVYR